MAVLGQQFPPAPDPLVVYTVGKVVPENQRELRLAAIKFNHAFDRSDSGQGGFENDRSYSPRSRFRFELLQPLRERHRLCLWGCRWPQGDRRDTGNYHYFPIHYTKHCVTLSLRRLFQPAGAGNNEFDLSVTQ